VPIYPFKHSSVDYGRQIGVFVDRYTSCPGVIMGATGFDMNKFLPKLCKN
jgi:hypothetical protein